MSDAIRSEWGDSNPSDHSAYFVARIAALERTIKKLRQERDALRGLLQKTSEYAQHAENCYALHMQPDLKCNCDLQSVLDGITAALGTGKEG